MRNWMLLTVLVTGCAGQIGRPLEVVNPSWLPEKGEEWAIADCDAKSAGVSGYDWIDAASKKADARDACLRAYGFNR